MSSSTTIRNRAASDNNSAGTTGRLSKKSANFLAILYAITRLFTIPYHLISNIPASRRSVPTWTYKTATGVAFWRNVFRLLTDIHLSGARSLEPGKEKDIFILSQPGDDTLYQGPLKSANVRPRAVPSVWSPKSPPTTSFDNNQLLVLQFHGGAYVSFTSRQLESRRGTINLCEQLGSAFALCPDYRKASDSGYSHFPAQLQDAVTTYAHALEMVKSSSQIILSGDSAGAHIVLSLLRYIERFKTLPKPKVALLHSPWLDLTEDGVSLQNTRNNGIDHVPTEWLAWGANAFTPPGMDRDNEWISPLFHPFDTSVPIWVQVGDKEVVYEDAQKFVKEWQSKVPKIKLWTVPDAPHDLFSMAPEFGMEKQQKEAIHDAVAFIREL